ncbi:DUF4347 domain-containing protein, partial [Phormidium pseudopriestleyi FRX01]
MTINFDLMKIQDKGTMPLSKTLVFIDSQVENYHSLLQGVGENVKAIALDDLTDGIQQITEVLQSLIVQGQTVDSIH